MSLGKVQVLLSAYQGCAFLQEQLDSIRNQDWPRVSLLVRDDGSRDETASMLESYQKEHPEFEMKVIRGENRGVLGSFMALVEASDPEASFYAFADQDDVWMPGKISRGVKLLQESGKLFYAGSYIPTDDKMQPLQEKADTRKPGFGNALVENIAIGCTIVFGQEMKRLILAAPWQEAAIHDWWFYLVAEAFDGIVFDEVPYLYYRQHSGNVIGSKGSLWAKWRSRVRRFSAWKEDVMRQARLLQTFYGDSMPSEKQALLKEFLSFRDLPIGKRAAYIRRRRVWRQHGLDGFLLDILLLFRVLGK